MSEPSEFCAGCGADLPPGAVAGCCMRCLGLAAFGATRAGLTGLALGWLIVISAQAILMAPALYRTARGGHHPARQREPDADPLGAVQPQHHLPWWAQPSAN